MQFLQLHLENISDQVIESMDHLKFEYLIYDKSNTFIFVKILLHYKSTNQLVIGLTYLMLLIVK